MKKFRVLFIEPHLGVVGGIRHIMEYANWLDNTKKYDVYIATPRGEKCNWIPNKLTFLSMSQIHTCEWDFVLFNDPSPEQVFHMDKVKSVVKIQLLLGYEPGYRSLTEAKSAIDSYSRPWIKLANSSYTSLMVGKHTNTSIPVIGCGLSKQYFYPVKTNKVHSVGCCAPPERPFKGYKLISDACFFSNNSVYNIANKGIPQEKLAVEYSKMKLFVSASTCEGFSLPALEAMACGVPVITCIEGGNIDYAKHMFNCYIVPDRTPYFYAEAIHILQNDKSLRNKLIEGGLATANSLEYSWDYRGRLLEYHMLENYRKTNSFVFPEKKMNKKYLVDIIFIRYNNKEVEDVAFKSIITKTNTKEVKYRIFDIDNYDREKKSNIKTLTTWWNELTSTSTADFICYLNTDIKIEDPNWLIKMCKVLDNNKVAAVGPRTNNSMNAGQAIPPDTNIVRLINSEAGHPILVKDISGFCFLLKKSIWEKLGGFNKEIPFYGAESEFFFRLTHNGYKIAICPNTFVYHEGESSIRAAEKRGELSVSSERKKGIQLYKKNIAKMEDKK